MLFFFLSHFPAVVLPRLINPLVIVLVTALSAKFAELQPSFIALSGRHIIALIMRDDRPLAESSVGNNYYLSPLADNYQGFFIYINLFTGSMHRVEPGCIRRYNIVCRHFSSKLSLEPVKEKVISPDNKWLYKKEKAMTLQSWLQKLAGRT